jgi:hypothetical protein
MAKKQREVDQTPLFQKVNPGIRTPLQHAGSTVPLIFFLLESFADIRPGPRPRAVRLSISKQVMPSSPDNLISGLGPGTKASALTYKIFNAVIICGSVSLDEAVTKASAI